MAASPAGTGGLWVAQRVPDGQFFVAANEFRIRDIVPGNPDQMYGKTLFATVERYNMKPDYRETARGGLALFYTQKC